MNPFSFLGDSKMRSIRYKLFDNSYIILPVWGVIGILLVSGLFLYFGGLRWVCHGTLGIVFVWAVVTMLNKVLKARAYKKISEKSRRDQSEVVVTYLSDPPYRS